MNLADSTTEAYEFFKKEIGLGNIEGVDFPIKPDTLEILNGMNYAQFLEALLRIGYIKAQQNEEFGKNSLNNIYKNELEKIFTGSQIDMTKRAKEDNILEEFYSEASRTIFHNYQKVLCAIFADRSRNREKTYPELDKEAFVLLMKETGIFKTPKPLTKEEEKKEKEAKESGKQYVRPP